MDPARAKEITRESIEGRVLVFTKDVEDSVSGGIETGRVEDSFRG